MGPGTTRRDLAWFMDGQRARLLSGGSELLGPRELAGRWGKALPGDGRATKATEGDALEARCGAFDELLRRAIRLGAPTTGDGDTTLVVLDDLVVAVHHHDGEEAWRATPVKLARWEDRTTGMAALLASSGDPVVAAARGVDGPPLMLRGDASTLGGLVAAVRATTDDREIARSPIVAWSAFERGGDIEPVDVMGDGPADARESALLDAVVTWHGPHGAAIVHSGNWRNRASTQSKERLMIEWAPPGCHSATLGMAGAARAASLLRAWADGTGDPSIVALVAGREARIAG